MNDADLDTLLRRYRPAGPPASLRNDVLAGAAISSTGVRLHEWTALAASAMFAAMFYWLAAIERQHVTAIVDVVPPIERVLTPTIAVEDLQP